MKSQQHRHRTRHTQQSEGYTQAASSRMEAVHGFTYSFRHSEELANRTVAITKDYNKYLVRVLPGQNWFNLRSSKSPFPAAENSALHEE